MGKLLSIIIPTYNARSSISRLLKSIDQQNFDKSKLEIIIVDDASPDRTTEVVQKIINDKTFNLDIVLFRQKKNKGNGPAKNKGVRLSKGKFLLFLDDHGYLTKKNTLTRFITLLQTTLADALCGYYRSSTTSDTNIIRDLRRKYVYKKQFPRWLTLSDWTTFSIVVGGGKRKIFVQVPFPENFGQHGAEDTYWQIVATNKGFTFFYTPKIFIYHDHGLKNKDFFKKLFTELRGVADLISTMYYRNPSFRIPYEPYFLSYDSFLFIFLIGSFFSFYFFAALLITLGLKALRLYLLVSPEKFATFKNKLMFSFSLPLIECFKVLYLPAYLVWVRKDLKLFFFFIKVIMKWNIPPTVPQKELTYDFS